MKKFISGMVLGFLIGAMSLGLFIFYIESREVSRDKIALLKAMQSFADLRNETVDLIVTGLPIKSRYDTEPENYPDIEVLYQSSDGDIIFRAKSGQLLWLHPRIENNKFYWDCLGAPKNAVRILCERL